MRPLAAWRNESNSPVALRRAKTLRSWHLSSQAGASQRISPLAEAYDEASGVGPMEQAANSAPTPRGRVRRPLGPELPGGSVGEVRWQAMGMAIDLRGLQGENPKAGPEPDHEVVFDRALFGFTALFFRLSRARATSTCSGVISPALMKIFNRPSRSILETLFATLRIVTSVVFATVFSEPVFERGIIVSTAVLVFVSRGIF